MGAEAQVPDRELQSVLKIAQTKIQQITFEDLNDFIKQIMNWAAFPLASKRAFQRGCTKWKVLYRRKGGEREILSNRGNKGFLLDQNIFF